MKINNDFTLIVLFICITIITCVGILSTESQHEKRMNLIKEQEALIRIEHGLDQKLFIDSMKNVVNKEIERFNNF